MSKVIRLEDKLAALDVREEAAPSADGERDATAGLYWGRPGDPDNELLAASNRREMALYPGRMLQDKRVLQRLGWAVFYCTARGEYAGKATAWLSIGKKVIPVVELRPMAERAKRDASPKREAA